MTPTRGLAIVVALVLGMGASGAARASATAGVAAGVNGTGTTPGNRYGSTPPGAVTVITAGGATSLDLCMVGPSWCAHGGPLWDSLLLTVDCSVVEGRTWYGGAWVTGQGQAVWWSFKIVDRPFADRIGMHVPWGWDADSTPPPEDRACGARHLRTAWVAAGDFQIR